MRKVMIMIALAVILLLTACKGQQADAMMEDQKYTQAYARDCAMLVDLSDSMMDASNARYMEEEMFHYQMQSDGRGLALMNHPDGQAMGFLYAVMYETTDGGQTWNVLHDTFAYDRGESVFVYMGNTAVLAVNAANGIYSSLMVSNDCGRTWKKMSLGDLVDYDEMTFDYLDPHVINYNGETGLITFGWTVACGEMEGDAPYVLINQFDADNCVFVEEIYRHPDFACRTRVT